VREILEEHALSQHFSQVSKVTLEIGKLTCVEPESLRFGFDVVMKGSMAENAELVITELDGVGFCQQCQKELTLLSLYDTCDYCGKPIVEIKQGLEMKIKDLVVI